MYIKMEVLLCHDIFHLLMNAMNFIWISSLIMKHVSALSRHDMTALSENAPACNSPLNVVENGL